MTRLRNQRRVRVSLKHLTHQMVEDRRRVRDFFLSRPWLQRSVLTLEESVWIKLSAWGDLRAERVSYLTGFVDAWLASER